MNFFGQDATAAKLAIMEDQVKDLQESRGTLTEQLTYAQQTAKEIHDIKLRVTDDNSPSCIGNDTSKSKSVSVESVVAKEFASFREEEERRPNLIIHNLPESADASKEVSNENDKTSFLDTAKTCRVAFSPKDVVKLTRLGRKSDEKPRPKLVDENKKDRSIQKSSYVHFRTEERKEC